VQRVHTREVTLPWYRDTWGNVLVGGGLAGFLVGTVAWVTANGRDDDATASASYQGFDDELRARDRWQLTGNIAFATGGVLVVGGLLHYALRPKRVRTEVLVDPAGGAASLGVSWSLR
jgi:hypothetical protein